MAEEGKNPVLCALAVSVIILSVLAVGSVPAGGASVVPCPFVPTPSRTSAGILSSSPPRVLNPCPGYEWAKTFGAADEEWAVGFDITSDGGAVLLVASYAYNPGVTVVKMDAEGVVQWQRFIDRGNNNGGIQQTSDGGYVVAVNVKTVESTYFAAVYRLDAYGQLLWQTSYGGIYCFCGGVAVSELQDGGFVVSSGADPSGAGNPRALWVLRLDSAGGVVWQKTYGDASYYGLPSVIPTPDGGFVATGALEGSAGLVIKLDASGNIVWQKKYAYVGAILSIATTSDGGYVFTANNPEPSGQKWGVVKLTATGTISWQKTYGESSGRGSIVQTADGGYVTSMTVLPFGNNTDIGLMRLDSTGKKLWQRSYGGPRNDHPCYPRCVMEAPDGNIMVVGQTMSYGAGGINSDGSGSDAWVLRVFSDGTISSTCDPTFAMSLQNPTVKGAKIKVSNLGFGATSTFVTPVNPGATASPGFLSSTTQCSA